ncbi:MAG: phospholipase [Candidatus Eisenbacteria bacterium]|nr:phospholipase [Candidatus Eisenbacteria bacterium]
MPDDSHDPLLRFAPATVHGRYFVRPPAGTGGACWLVGFHGQGQTAEAFFPSLARVPRSGRWLVASVQGLNRYYSGRSDAVVANWMTRQDREQAIADNVAWVDGVCDALEREFGPPRAIVFAGFSQGVAMAYRAGLLGRRECAAIIVSGGDVPPEFAAGTPRPWPRVLVATGDGDGWFTPARLEGDLAIVRLSRPDARWLVFEGGHEWSEALSEAAGGLLAEIERGA